MSVVFALDYDGTYTAAPELWDRFIEDAHRRGYTVVCVTMRKPEERLDVDLPCEVIYTSRRAKVPYMKRLGIRVNIWIDDSPHWLLSDAAA